MKQWLAALAVLIGAFVIGAVCFLLGMQRGDISIMTVDRYHSASAKNSAEEDKDRVPGFIGYVRGRSQTTLRNKYAGFVSKVRIYSHTKVKKGGCNPRIRRSALAHFDEKTRTQHYGTAENIGT